MAIRRRSNTSTISAGSMSVAILHTEDSIRLGDGTNLMGAMTAYSGVYSLPVDIKNGKVQIWDTTNPVGVSNVGGSYALKVDVIQTTGGGASGGTSMVDDAAFTPATSSVTPMGAMADEVAADSVDEGDIGVVRMTLDRLLKIQVAGVASGIAVPISDNSGSITVDGTFWQATQPVSGTFWQATQPVSGTVAFSNTTIATTNAGTFAVQDSQVLADNAGFTDGTTKLFASGYIFDEVAGTALTENDIAAARLDSKRAQVLVIEDSSTRGQRATVSAAGAVKVDGSAVTQPVSGTFWQATQPVSGTFWQATQPVSGTFWQATQPVSGTVSSIDAGVAAHDAAVSGNPVRVAGRAMLANGTAVQEDDVADIATDNQGRVINTPHVPRDLVSQGTTTYTTTTEATVLSAGGASVFLDLTKLIITNSSATAVRVDIRDVTGGTVRLPVAIAANGGAVIDFGDVPMTQTTANGAWTAQLSGAVSSVYVFMQAVKRIA